MLDENRVKEAEINVKNYLNEGLLKKTTNETAISMYMENSDLSLNTARKLLDLENEEYKPYLWIIVTSYYAMYYIANAVLLNMGYKVGDKIPHKVTSDSLIALVRNKLKKEFLENYEESKEDALELISSEADNIIESFDLERDKRSRFQYRMDEQIKKAKAITSLSRAIKFLFEMKKLIK